MYGPQGIGTLYVRRELQERIEPLIYGGGQQEGLRSGTVPMPLCVGMGAAAKFFTGREAIEERKRVARQRDSFVTRLQQGHAFVAVNGPAAAVAATRATPMSGSTASTRRKFLAPCSRDSLRLPAPPVRPVSPNRPMCFAPWASPRHRAMRPSASASAGLLRTTIAKLRRALCLRFWLCCLQNRLRCQREAVSSIGVVRLTGQETEGPAMRASQAAN